MHVIRSNEKQLYDSFNLEIVTVVVGPRRVGKSTLVKDFIEKNPENLWFTFNMDSMQERKSIESEGIQSLIEQRALQKIGAGKKFWVAIDEAQKCPDLFEQIKIIYDDFKDKRCIKFILTGSGLLHLHRLSAESLAGRVEIYHLYPFALKEACMLLHPEVKFSGLSLLDMIFSEENSDMQIKDLMDEMSPLKKVLENTLSMQLCFGGLPEVLQQNNDAMRISYLANYLQTYLEKDVRAITTITDINLYHKLLQIIAQQTGSVRQEKRIADALQCKNETVKKYRGFLEATFLYREIYPFIDSPLKRLTKSPKGYLVDNGLISYLTDINDLNTLVQSGLIGARFENWFLNELQVALAHSPRIADIYFWRTSVGSEVDFIIKRGDKIFPFEVTYGKNPVTKKVNNLSSFLRHANTPAGFYIYNGDYFYDAQKHIYFIPAWLLA